MLSLKDSKKGPWRLVTWQHSIYMCFRNTASVVLHHITQISHVIWRQQLEEPKSCKVFTVLLHGAVSPGSRAHKKDFHLEPSCFLSWWSCIWKEPPLFCFALWRPSDLFNKPAEYWLTVNGHIGLEVFFFTHCRYFTLHRWESWLLVSSEHVMVRAKVFILIVVMETCRFFDK